MAYDFKKEMKELYHPSDKPSIVDVPTANYISLKGYGNPNEEGGFYQKALNIMYAIAYTLKMSYKGDHKIKGFYEYVVPPLEGFWWQDDVDGVDYSAKERFNWISLLRLPEFVTKEEFEWAKKAAAQKKKINCDAAEYLTVSEGLCVQIMHTGTFDEEPASVEKMNTYLEMEGYVNDITNTRLHHEIYLTDSRKTEPSKQKTVLRHPIKKINE